MGGWVVSSFYQNKSKILYIFPPSKPANILLWSPGWPSASVHPPALDWARYILLSISQIMSLCLPTTVKIILLRKDNNLQEDILSLHSQVLTVYLIHNRRVSFISKGFGKKLIPKIHPILLEYGLKDVVKVAQKLYFPPLFIWTWFLS